MKAMKRPTQVTVVVTVLNEVKTVSALIKSLQNQTLLPIKVIIVDGGSSDATLEILTKLAKTVSEFPITVLQKKGNRSIGRNAGIAEAATQLIAITDAGCTVHTDWLAKLVTEYSRSQARVVAGYYTAAPKSTFEEAVVPYVLVMPDAVSTADFLPATRSVLLEKSVWEELGGFPEAYSDNEDYVFAQKLRTTGIPRSMARDAVVVWQPVNSLSQFFWMLFRFARGDMFAAIVRPKVVVLFTRYALALVLAVVVPMLILPALALYLLWAILKNKRYVEQGWFWLPVLQITADCAVLSGSVAGLLQRLHIAKR